MAKKKEDTEVKVTATKKTTAKSTAKVSTKTTPKTSKTAKAAKAKTDTKAEPKEEEKIADIMTEKKAKEILAKLKVEEKDRPELIKEIDGVSYILEEHADEMVDMELTRQLWEHIELVSKKMNLSIEEAGKIFGIDDEKELMCLRFHAFTMDTIEQAAEDVMKKYAKKQAAAKKAGAEKKTVVKKADPKIKEKKEAKPKKEIKAKKETKAKES